MHNWILSKPWEKRFLPFKLPMKSILIALSVLLAAACDETKAGKIKCGMASDGATLRDVLASSASCPQCLLDEINAVAQACPRDPAIGVLGFYASMRTERSQEAIAFYEELAAVPSISYEVHADAGATYDALGDGKSALTAYQRSLQQKNDPFVRLEAAFIMVKLGQLDNAAKEFHVIMDETGPALRAAKPGTIGVEAVYDDAAFALAEIYQLQGDATSARATYERILSLYPGDERAMESLRALAAGTVN